MKSPFALTLALCFAGPGLAIADTPTQADKGTTTTSNTAKVIKPTTITCQEFLAYDEVTRPQIVYWSEGLNRKGKPKDAVIDIDRINNLVPVLVDDCTKEPQSSYWQKMKREMKRIF
jgi:hypothetical protein